MARVTSLRGMLASKQPFFVKYDIGPMKDNLFQVPMSCYERIDTVYCILECISKVNEL